MEEECIMSRRGALATTNELLGRLTQPGLFVLRANRRLLSSIESSVIEQSLVDVALGNARREAFHPYSEKSTRTAVDTSILVKDDSHSARDCL